jgi:hypothetical protein
VFGENFNDNLLHTGEASVQLIADATDPNQATTLTGYATGVVGGYRQELMRTCNIPVQINPQIRMLYLKGRISCNYIHRQWHCAVLPSISICGRRLAIGKAVEKNSKSKEITTFTEIFLIA